MAQSMRDLNYYFRQSSFAGGEIGEDLYGRDDYAKYAVSLSDATNMYSLPYGGMTSRAGTEFITDIGSAENSVQLIPFQFNTEQQYMMVFCSDGYIYFFANQGYLVDDDGGVYKIAHSIDPSDIGVVNYVQSADTMFLCSPQSGIFKLERYGERDFRWSNFVPEAGAFGIMNDTDTYLESGTFTGTTEHGQGSVSVPYYVNTYSFDTTDGDDPINAPTTSAENAWSGNWYFGNTTQYSGSYQVNPSGASCPLSWDITPFCYDYTVSQWTSGQSYSRYYFVWGYAKIVVEGYKANATGGSWTTLWSQEKTSGKQETSRHASHSTKLDYAHWTGSATVSIPSGYSQIRVYTVFNNPSGGQYQYQMTSYDRTVKSCTLTVPAWTETWEGTDLNVLQASDDLFVSSDVGRTVMVNEAVAAHEAHFNGGGTSGWLPCKGDWSIIMSGSFNGTITIQKSRDKGATAEALRSWTMTDLGSFEDSGSEDDFCYLRLIVDRTNDKGIVQLNVDSFVHTVYATITSYISPTQVRVSFKNSDNKSEWGFIEKLNKCYAYTLSAWSQTLGYPRAVTLFADRLVFASSPAYPLNVWFSATGDYYNFRTEVDDEADDGAITITLTSQTMNNINTLISKNDLLGFSEGGVWKINSRSSVTGLTAETVYAQQQNFEGSKRLSPILVNNHFLYVLDLGSTVRDLAYNYNMDSYVGDDITILARHLFNGQDIISWCYAQEPDSLVYAVRSDGVLLTLTYVKDQDVFAFAKHTTQGLFKAVGTIRGQRYSDVYFVIERSGKLYIEVLGDRLNQDTTSFVFMDCSAVYSGEPTNRLTGLDYLEGYTVQVLGDGSELPEQVVEDGVINLPRQVSYARVGLGYNKSCTTMDLDIPRDDGTGFSRKKSVGNVKVLMRQSAGGMIEVEGDDNVHKIGQFLPVRYGLPLTLFSGTMPVSLNATYLHDAKITVSSDRPVPLNILAIMADVSLGG